MIQQIVQRSSAENPSKIKAFQTLKFSDGTIHETTVSTAVDTTVGTTGDTTLGTTVGTQNKNVKNIKNEKNVKKKKKILLRNIQKESRTGRF